MLNSFYERHQHPNPQFPFIFHLDNPTQQRPAGVHWHESIELLFFVDGAGIVFSNMNHYPAQKGDIAVINSGALHTTYCKESLCSYYCLIVDKSFSDELGISVEMLEYRPIIHDEKANEWMQKIVNEMTTESNYYQQSVKSSVAGLLVHLCRNHLVSTPASMIGRDSRKANMVKAGIGIIRQRFQQPLSVDEICDSIGFSKYYFCRVFKEYTGSTVTDYINFLRCSSARSLIRSGNYNISESARISGVPNLSYFTKLYKRYMGVAPSEDSRVPE